MRCAQDLRPTVASPDRFRISDFGFRICRPQSASSTGSLQSAWHFHGWPHSEDRVWKGAQHSPDTRDLDVPATRIASSTADTPQSATKTIYHSYLSERRGGRSPRGFPRAGGRGVGAGKKEFEGVPPLECSPPARRRRSVGRWWDRGTLAFRGHTIVQRVAAGEDRGRRADQSPASRHFGQPDRQTREITLPVPPKTRSTRILERWSVK